MGNNNISKARSFYERREAVRQVVLERLRRSKNVLTGSRALNRNLPYYLKKKLIKDYDVLVRNGISPMKAAVRMEKALDERFGGDYFSVTEGKYPEVRKVISNITKDEVVDFVPMPKPKPKIRKSYDGVRHAGLKYLKGRFKAALADPTQEFRHKKDAESLKRIEVYETFHKSSGGITGSKKFKWEPLPREKPIVKGLKKRKKDDYFSW